MSSLADLTELVGFFSYSRRDDEHSDGALSRLRARINGELRLHLGREFRLWQDIAAIPQGALWEEEIKRAIAESVFFIPIVTPGAVASQHCRFEFGSFVKREAVLGRSNLIFPILYVRVPALEKEAEWRRDDVLKVIGARQYADWQRIRLRSPSEPEVAEKIERYCANIAETLREPWTSPEQRAERERVRQDAEEEARRSSAQRRAAREAEERARQEVERLAREAEQRQEDWARKTAGAGLRAKVAWLFGAGAAAVVAANALVLIRPPTHAPSEQPRAAAEAPIAAPTVQPQAPNTAPPNVAPQAPLSPERERALKPKDAFVECSRCPEMLVVPAGSFMMGSPKGGDEERPQHNVTIAKPFAVSRYEVTFDDWDSCVEQVACKQKPPDGFWGRGQRPVMSVSWDDAQQYVTWIITRTGKPYRLLTEAEWEYAARAGTTTAYFWGDDIGKGNANCNGCGSQWDNKQTAPVGSFKPNAFGLYDVHGNVWEWTEDCWHLSYAGAPADGTAWATSCQGGSRHVVRGGAWSSALYNLSVTTRIGWVADDRFHDLGFRLARTLNP